MAKREYTLMVIFHADSKDTARDFARGVAERLVDEEDDTGVEFSYLNLSAEDDPVITLELVYASCVRCGRRATAEDDLPRKDEPAGTEPEWLCPKCAAAEVDSIIDQTSPPG